MDLDLTNEKLISDLRVYEASKVSREHGRQRLKSLEASGQIAPLRTPTGRCLLSVIDAEALAKAL